MASSINNGESGLSVRTKLNTSASELNTATSDITGKQPLDSDLTDIAALTPSNDDSIYRVAGAWANRTVIQAKTILALNNVDNTSDVNKPVSTAQSAADALKQDKDAASTLFNTVRTAVADVTLASTDKNVLHVVTNTAPSLFNILVGMAGAFNNGGCVYLYNHVSSTDEITITPAGGVTFHGETTVLVGQTAKITRQSTNVYIRQEDFLLTGQINVIQNLSPSANDFLTYIAGNWANRTVAQTKTTLSLNNVDNTSDANKPVSTAQAAADALKQDKNAISTLLWSVSTVKTGNVAIGASDHNLFTIIENAAPTTLTLNAGAPTFDGSEILIYSTALSAGNVTITLGGGVTLVGSATITPDSYAKLIKTTTPVANTWYRVF